MTLYDTITQIIGKQKQRVTSIGASSQFVMNRLSIVDQLHIMLGEPHAIIQHAPTVLQVQRAVLLAVGSWMMQRRLQLQQLEQAMDDARIELSNED